LFKSKYPSEAFDQALWKQFWFQTQQYHTLCLWKHHPIDFASNTKSIAVFWLRTARAKIQRDNATFKNE